MLYCCVNISFTAPFSADICTVNIYKFVATPPPSTLYKDLKTELASTVNNSESLKSRSELFERFKSQRVNSFIHVNLC